MHRQHLSGLRSGVLSVHRGTRRSSDQELRALLQIAWGGSALPVSPSFRFLFLLSSIHTIHTYIYIQADSQFIRIFVRMFAVTWTKLFGGFFYTLHSYLVIGINNYGHLSNGKRTQSWDAWRTDEWGYMLDVARFFLIKLSKMNSKMSFNLLSILSLNLRWNLFRVTSLKLLTNLASNFHINGWM